jgi:hypothetical protein
MLLAMVVVMSRVLSEQILILESGVRSFIDVKGVAHLAGIKLSGSLCMTTKYAFLITY